MSIYGQITARSMACRERLMEILPQYSNMSKTVPNGMIKSFVISMNTEFRTRKSSVNPESNLEISFGKNLFVAKNSEILSISDTVDSFTLVNKTKVIVHSKSLFSKLSDSISLGLSEKMLANIDLFECSEMVQSGSRLLKVVCTPKKELKDEAMIESIEYVIDQTKGLLKSSVIFYTSKSEIKSMTLRYGPINVVVRPSEYTNEVRRIFLTNKGTLLEKYRSYKFFENTKK